MAFTVTDFEDLERLLAEHPEWRARLRPLIVGDELLQVPEQLSAVERRIDERLDRITAVLDSMAARQDEFDRRLDALTERMDRLTERMDRVEAQLLHLSAEVTRLTGEMNRMNGRMGNIEGQLLEDRYERNARHWLTDWVRRPQRTYIDELDLLDQAVSDGRVSAIERKRVKDLDLLVRGAGADGGGDTILALEVSHTVNVEDVERAADRASILRRAGYRSIAITGGYMVTPEARAAAERYEVVVDLHRLQG